MPDPKGFEVEKEMKYDLRQRYANFVGDHIDDVGFYRKRKNYPDYFQSLKELYVVTEFKWRDSKQEESQQKYEELIEAIARHARQYPTAWRGNLSDPKAIALIEHSLYALEKFLFRMMEDANMFGTKFEDDGL